jgi:hypothetical protein
MATYLDWELMSRLSARQGTADEFKHVVEPTGLKIVGIFEYPQGVDSLLELELAWRKRLEDLLCTFVDIGVATDDGKSLPRRDQSVQRLHSVNFKRASN